MTKIRHSKLFLKAIGLGLILVALTFLLVLAYQERAVLLSHPWQFRWPYLITSFVLFLVALVLAALIWADLMHRLGSKLSLHHHVRYFCISQLARRLPGTIWYVVGRSYLYKREGELTRLVSLASGIELVVMLLAGILASVAMATQWLVALPMGYLYGLFFLLPVFILLLHPRTVTWSLRRISLDDAPLLHFSSVLRWVVGYIAIWLLGGLIFYLALNVVLVLPLVHLPFVIGIWCFVGVSSIAVFFLPTNLGFSELGLSLLLSTILPLSISVSVAILTRILLLVFEAMAILVVLFWYMYKQPQAEVSYGETIGRGAAGCAKRVQQAGLYEWVSVSAHLFHPSPYPRSCLTH